MKTRCNATEAAEVSPASSAVVLSLDAPILQWTRIHGDLFP